MINERATFIYIKINDVQNDVLKLYVAVPLLLGMSRAFQAFRVWQCDATFQPENVTSQSEKCIIALKLEREASCTGLSHPTETSCVPS